MPKGHYSNQLEARYHPDLEEWEVINPFFFIRPCGDVITIPAGIFTDLASTMNLPVFPKDDEYNQAAVVHDFLYQGEFFPRRISDSIFKEALEAIPQVRRWKIPVMFWAVRMFGGLVYKRHRIVDVSTARRLARVNDTEKRPLWPDGVARFV